MTPRISDLWRLDGTVDRGPYLFWGTLLVLAKYNIDRIVVGVATGKVMQPFSYFVPGDLFGVLPRSPERAASALPILLVALPFVWTGIALTLRRVRAVRMPVGSVLLFFVPVVNLLFFALLSALPSSSGMEDRLARRRGSRFLDRAIPDSAPGSAAMALALVLPVTAGLTWLCASQLGSYGWGLFVGLPFFLGLASVLVHGYHRPRPLWSCLVVAGVATMFLAVMLLALAVEGLICIAMAAPLALGLSIFGAIVGYFVQRRPAAGAEAPPALGGIAILLPMLSGAERWSAPEPPMIEVTTSVEIAAPPERVWEHVVAFAELPPPDEWLFRAGVAHPLRAEIDGSGPGAVRRCVFSTGAFVEPIEVWDAPRRLEFGVVAQPAPMRELSPYPEIAPPHLERHLESHRGRFLLEPLPGGGTRLLGTTWYTNRMWPAPYWRLWSDRVIHAIHRRVLEHIRLRSES